MRLLNTEDLDQQLQCASRPAYPRHYRAAPRLRPDLLLQQAAAAAWLLSSAINDIRFLNLSLFAAGRMRRCVTHTSPSALQWMAPLVLRIPVLKTLVCP